MPERMQEGRFIRAIKPFILGAASIFDIVGILGPRVERYPFFRRTDTEALYSDWEKVGKDLRKAICKVTRNL